MHFPSLFAAATLIGVAISKPSSGIPHDDHDALAQLEKRQGQRVLTTGAVGLGDNRIHARLEINDFSTNRPALWSLYIRTVTRWKTAPKSDPTGYFGISSIHGVPRDSWDGVERCDTCEGADGYCTHDSIHFPAWHRGYNALHEQELIKLATDVANSFDGAFGDSLKAAAQVLRMPYWDFAARPNPDGRVLPAVITRRQVTIMGPNGDETVDNPLHNYRFSDPSDMYYSVFPTWQNTLRWPTGNDRNANSQNTLAVQAFANIQQNLQDQVYQLLTQCRSYTGFATDDDNNNACANSIESIHNTIHTTVGGHGNAGISGGHMTYLPIASFDPLFWLLHSNIDRLFALWQTINPDRYGATQVAQHSTWTFPSGSTQNSRSPLRPFRRTADTYWNTQNIKDFQRTFQYTYPEFSQGDQSRDAIINMVNSLYGPQADATASTFSSRTERSTNTRRSANRTPARARSVAPPPPSYGDKSSSSSKLPWNKPNGSSSGAHPDIVTPWNATTTHGYPAPTGTGSPKPPKKKPIDPAFFAPNGSLYQYQCNVQTPRYAFDGSYVVYVFDGQPSSNDTMTWLGDENCIGQLGIFAGGNMTGHGSLSSGAVPITRHLQKQYKAGKLPALSEDVVVPYMKKNLNWKIVFQGEEIRPDELTGYKASFVSGLLSPHVDGVLPTWSNFVPHVDVTKGKAGGITKLVDGLFGGVTDTLEHIGDVLGLGGLLGSPDLSGQGKPDYDIAHSVDCATTSTEGPPAPITTEPPSPSTTEAVTTTIYTTTYVTYCPCQESESTAAPSPEGYHL